MQSVLNFSAAEKKKVADYLRRFEQTEPANKFEEARCKIGDCVAILYSSGKLLIQGNGSEKVKEKILEEIGLADELFLGIDEAGRGESSGPLVVAGVLGKVNSLRELRDSKKTRNIVEKRGIVLGNSIANFAVSVSAEAIDGMRSQGKNMNAIEAEIIDSIVSAARKSCKEEFRVIVDGNPLQVTVEGVEFLPKADDLNPVVGAASVLAKATRDESADKTVRKSWKTKEKN